MSRTTLDELVLMVVRDKATKKRSASSKKRVSEENGKRKRARVVPSVPNRETVSTPPVRHPKAQVSSVRKEKKRARRAGSSKRSYSRRDDGYGIEAVRLWNKSLDDKLLMEWNEALDRYSEICAKFCEKQRENAVRGDIEQHKKYLDSRGLICIRKDAHERYQDLMTRIQDVISPQLDKEGLRIVRDWKMTRCIWRPGWIHYDKNEDWKIKQVTESGFKKINGLDKFADKDSMIRDAIKKLEKLKGVGPSTACGILSLKSRDVAYFSPESLLCCTRLAPDAFTKNKFFKTEAAVTLNRLLRERAEKLTEFSKSSMRDVRRYWGARDVEYALFSAAHASLRGNGV